MLVYSIEVVEVGVAIDTVGVAVGMATGLTLTCWKGQRGEVPLKCCERRS